MSLTRFFVAVLVGVPLLLMVGWPHPWWVTLLIGLSAGGAGYGAEALLGRRKNAATLAPAEKTETDRAWEVRMVLKKALAAENRGEWDQAAALFEQLIQRDDNPENVALAREHLERIRNRQTPRGPVSTSQPAIEAGGIVGVWEQVGMLNPSSGAAAPWPEGSLNASVREFFAFFDDGSFVFGRFLAGADVRFDEDQKAFVCDGHTDKMLHGSYRVDGNQLIEEFAMPDGEREVRTVELGELGEERFVVKEQTPLPGFALQVVYKKVQGLTKR